MRLVQLFLEEVSSSQLVVWVFPPEPKKGEIATKVVSDPEYYQKVIANSDCQKTDDGYEGVYTGPKGQEVYIFVDKSEKSYKVQVVFAVPKQKAAVVVRFKNEDELGKAIERECAKTVKKIPLPECYAIEVKGVKVMERGKPVSYVPVFYFNLNDLKKVLDKILAKRPVLGKVTGEQKYGIVTEEIGPRQYRFTVEVIDKDLVRFSFVAVDTTSKWRVVYQFPELESYAMKLKDKVIEYKVVPPKPSETPQGNQTTSENIVT